jgi:hypothetical protein
VISNVNSLNIKFMINNSKNHLDEVNETYLKHMLINFKIGLSTLANGFKFLIHGIVPALFKNDDK